ncbi:hypothetical protein [uncultured Pontibacter sp.]|uniref:hypothetical protein n=1 Tax=uncultured Pontibacter sp. TaxID=453356 RepID=UPI00260D78B6|nr:hypothetical protein [uncultured Pontibacter sp.]
MVRHTFDESEDNPGMGYTVEEDLLKNKLSSSYDAESQTLLVTWEGAVTSHEVRQGYMQIKELVLYYKPGKWLIDLHKRESIKRADQHWVITHFFPEALRLLKKDIFVAIILPLFSFPRLVDELNGDEFIQGDNFMIINHFLYREEALRWLSNTNEFQAGA